MTLDGFGSTSDGSYIVTLGTIVTGAAGVLPSCGLQVDGFSLYPKRGQTIVAGVGDITGVLNPIQNVTINGDFSTFNNMRFWSYPGGTTPTLVPLSSHSTQSQTITITSNDSVFNNVIVGFGEETPLAVGDVGTLSIPNTGRGLRNTFNSIQTSVLTASTTPVQFTGCAIRPTGSVTVVLSPTTQCSGNNFLGLPLAGTTSVANI
jgi:hypothetical protein